MKDLILILVIIAYDFAIVAGTAYLITFHNWSMWAFVLTMIFFLLPKRIKDAKDE